MEFTTTTGLTLIALLLAFWALTWARRAASAAERIAIAAEKSALAAERSAMAARRGAEAAEASAVSARDAAGIIEVVAADDESRTRNARIDRIAKDVMESWPEEASAWPVIKRHTELPDSEVDEIVQKAFHAMGRSEAEATQHAVAVRNMRRDRQPQGATS